MPTSPLRRYIPGLLLATGLAFGALPAIGQDAIPPEQEALIDRPIVSVELRGLDRVDQTRIRNILTTQPGNPFNPRDIALDMDTLERLDQFRTITPTAELLPSGGVAVTFTFQEQPILRDVQVVGNSVVSDGELLSIIPITAGVPRDQYSIETAVRRIKELYRERGYFRAEVRVEEEELEESGILLLQIIEGPRVRIREIAFEGNDAFSDRQLRSQLNSEEAFFLLKPGKLDQQLIAEDLAALDSYYKDRGYLDVRVDRQIQLSPDDTEAKLVFVIREGRIYTLRNITVTGSDAFSPQQLAGIMEIKTGDIYSQDRIRESLEVVRDYYGRMGYPGVTVSAQEIRVGEEPLVDLRLVVNESQRTKLGRIEIVGNHLTRSKVILRELRGVKPGRYLDEVALEESRRRLESLRLFNEVEFTLQDPTEPESQYRDLLIDVKERDTGSFNFGVAFGSDSGVFGDFSLNQRNFDIADTPESFSEWISGRAFRGAGQRFQIRAAPGDEVSEFSISLTEPYLFETFNALTTSASYREREFDVFDEERISGRLGLSRQIGEFWSIGSSFRAEQVELPAIAPFAPTEIFEDAASSNLFGLRLNVTRNTTGTIVRPGEGSVFELAIEQVTGDFSFTTVSSDYTVFITFDEDFLGRRSILRLNSRVAYIFNGDEAPIYEQFYLGGRTFRGFEFRTISPKGIRADNGEPSDEPVGGEFLFFLGAQYEFPLFEDTITGVFFVDSGTVDDDIGLDAYRVSVGAGIRLYIAAFGPVPIAFDVAVPVFDEELDEEELFSFSVEFPF